jgi:hypothetical protein
LITGLLLSHHHQRRAVALAMAPRSGDGTQMR